MSTFDHHPWTVEELVRGVNRGEVRLPDIQRPFVWHNAKIRDLVDSMYRGYPVGELMFWRNVDPLKSKTIGDSQKTQDGSFQVVDGQQRMTSLYATVTGHKVVREDYSLERVQIAFNPLTERFEVGTNQAIAKSREWIADIVPLFNDAYAVRRAYLDGLRADDKYDVDEQMERTVEERLAKVVTLKNYKFEVVQIKDDVPREVVADIFVRINSEGVALSSADFILTWLSVFWEEGREQLETWARNSRFTAGEVSNRDGLKCTWTPINAFMTFQPGQILRVAVAVGLERARLDDAYNYLRGRDPRTREIVEAQRDEALARLKEGQAHALNPLHWDEFQHVLERAGFRSADLITSFNTILYTYAMWIIGRVRFGVPIDELREVMARWFFMSQVTGRYTNSPESRMAEELNRFKDAKQRNPQTFLAILNGQIDAAVPEDWWRVTLVDSLVTSSIKSPSWTAYVAALNVLDADVLLSTTKVKDWVRPGRRPIKGIEKHHLFPYDYLKTRIGLKNNTKVNQVANYALVEWSDNIDISNAAPDEYWGPQLADKAIEGDRLARQTAWHAIPDQWTQMTYDEFLAARRVLLAKVIHEGFKQLSDPNYRPDFSSAPVAAASVAAALPSFADLVAGEVIPVGTILTPVNEDRDTVAEVTEDGYIAIGAHRHDTIDIAAREDGADGLSGWDYWVAHLDDGTEKLLADLRAADVVGSPA